MPGIFDVATGILEEQTGADLSGAQSAFEQTTLQHQLGNITGANQAAAAQEAAAGQEAAALTAAELQAQSTTEQIAAQEAAAAQQRADLAPFTQFGASFIDPTQQAVAQSQQLFSDPSSILNNPFLQALQAQAQTNILQNQAVRGRLGTGETPQFLQDAAIRTGFDVLNQERQAQIANVNQLRNLVAGGQSAAAGQGQGALATGANIAGTLQQGATGQNQLTTDAAAAQAAGVIGAANASAAGTQNLISLGTSAFGSPTVGSGVPGQGVVSQGENIATGGF